MNNKSITLINLKSNIMVKSRYLENETKYLPIDLLPSEFSDVRSSINLSAQQSIENFKRHFFAKRFVDVVEETEMS